MSGFRELKADGIDRVRLLDLLRRLPDGGTQPRQRTAVARLLGHGWGFAWPADRRIMYNRASARPDGTPWSERKKLVWWDAAKREWTGLDVPDFTRDEARPTIKPATRREGRRSAARRRAVHHASRRRRLDLGADRA